ncbi:hypothetical protein VTK26DRAFT_5313 [Humicola hyalothermophila]
MAHTTSSAGTDAESDFLLQTYTRLRQAIAERTAPRTTGPEPSITPSSSALATCLSSLPHPSSPTYLQPLGPSRTHAHLLSTILPALNLQSLSPRYLAFVTGGVLPIAEAADNLVTALDQNVQVHFPFSSENPPCTAHSAGTAVEDAALRMLISLLDLDGDGDGGTWQGRTFTTGATASNVLGLACAREAIIDRRLASLPPSSSTTSSSSSSSPPTVSTLGLLAACQLANISAIQILTSMGHSSLSKAASVVGLGRASVRELGRAEEPWRLDLDRVEEELARAEAEGRTASIIVVSAGEVNTGRFATSVLDMPKLRSLADRYGAWIHVDGAFGIFARALPKTDEFLSLHACVAGLELADSIAADGHKILNVPYDNGIFLCRDASVLTAVCSNTNAAYLASPASGDANAILSPLNIGIENSRRFRALSVYAVLLSEGRSGIAAMLSRMVLLARAIAAYVRDSPHYELLPGGGSGDDDASSLSLESTYMVVLFRARDEALNDVLVDRINGSGRVFVSGTRWGEKKAVRMAVSNWRVEVEKDAEVVREVLTAVAEGR